MEQCFTLATDYFSEGEVSEKRAYRAPSQPSLRRSSVRKRPSLCTSVSSVSLWCSLRRNQQTTERQRIQTCTEKLSNQ
jgi:hypothetical protein